MKGEASPFCLSKKDLAGDKKGKGARPCTAAFDHAIK